MNAAAFPVMAPVSVPAMGDSMGLFWSRPLALWPVPRWARMTPAQQQSWGNWARALFSGEIGPVVAGGGEGTPASQVVDPHSSAIDANTARHGLLRGAKAPTALHRLSCRFELVNSGAQ